MGRAASRYFRPRAKRAGVWFKCGHCSKSFDRSEARAMLKELQAIVGRWGVDGTGVTGKAVGDAT